MRPDRFDRRVAAEDLAGTILQKIADFAKNVASDPAVRDLAGRHRKNLAVEILEAFFRVFEQFDVFLDGVFALQIRLSCHKFSLRFCVHNLILSRQPQSVQDRMTCSGIGNRSSARGSTLIAPAPYDLPTSARFLTVSGCFNACQSLAMESASSR